MTTDINRSHHVLNVRVTDLPSSISITVTWRDGWQVFVDTVRKRHYPKGMAEKISIALSETTLAWLRRESALTGRAVPEFVAELLRELADPDNVEGDLIDRLLAEATQWFPPLMTSEEQDEMREEVLDFLCHRIQGQHLSQRGFSMTAAEVERFRERLSNRADAGWKN